MSDKAYPSFADINDLEARWKTLEEEEKQRATIILSDASALIASLCEASGVTLPTLEAPNLLLSANLVAVCCEVVKRAMVAPEDRAGVKSAQEMAGNYMEMLTWETPSGDLYLTSSEKRRLGIGRGRIAFIDILGGG